MVLETLPVEEDKCQKMKQDGEKEENDMDKQSKSLTFRDKITIMMLSWPDFLSFCAMSIMAPFFPREALAKGMSETQSGFVFGFNAVMVIIASPIAGKLVPRIGMKFVFTAGMVVLGLTNILFGMLDFIQDYTTFAVLAFIIRGCQGIGTAFYSTGSFVIITKIFPEHGGLVRGILEVFVGLGLSVGPAIGGFLFDVGGFQLPFYLVGGIFLVVAPFNRWLIPIEESASDEEVIREGSFRKLLKLPSVLVTSLVLVVITVTWSCLHPTLEPYLRKYDLSVTSVGFVFLLLSLMYLITSPISGWLSDRIRNFWILMVVGLIFSGLSLLLLAFSEVLSPDGNLYWDAGCLAALGTFIGFGIIPTYQGVLHGAICHGKFDDNVTTQGLVAGLWSSLYAVGESVGPMAGGVLLTQVGFPIMVGSMGVINLLVGLLSFFYYYTHKHKYEDKLSNYTNMNQGYDGSPTQVQTISELITTKL